MAILADTTLTQPKKKTAIDPRPGGVTPGINPGIGGGLDSSPGQTPGINPGVGGGLDTSPGGPVTGVPSPTAPQTGGLDPRPGGLDTSPGGPVQPTPTPTPTPLPSTTPAPIPRVNAPMEPNAALQSAQQAFQARFNRAMTPDEQELAIQVARQNGWSGTGPVPAAALNAVYAAIETYQDPNAPQPGSPRPELPPPVPGVDPNVALQGVRQAFQQRFGRPMNPQEEQLAIQVARQNGWDGTGPVPQGAIDAVNAAMQTYQPPGGGPVDTTQPVPTTPTEPANPNEPIDPNTPIDPNVAQRQIDDAFRQRFGRDMTPEERNWLYQMGGYTPGGQVNQGMLTRGLDAIGRYSGNIDEPIEVLDPTEEAARRRLEELLGLSYGEVDMNSPAMRQQTQAFDLRNQRDTSRRRAVLAERAAARGGINAGGFDVDTERLYEEEGERGQAFEAQLMAGELADQRKNLTQAIELALQTGQQDKARELQEKLGLLDIDLKKYLGKGQLGLGLLSALMGDEQFYDKLGFDYAGLQNKANTDALMALLASGGY